ncbi:hypothetical protein EUGRSUZ_D02659 [Eucalyptus grandis]|uniref:Disease resistance R13L4/SHOC-2-like LRR domain-containing protein n=1 Tax=Eucalyptus grandis TaxID=71139 RepID=A0A059CJY7_EUCGR|nr:hypothetical protein EUGRSUZ_D02659 [Eucalyptus grandis]
MAEKLKYLDLSRCECSEDTDFLSAFKKLEVLILNGCRGLKRISYSVEDMKALLCLELSYCYGIRELPAEIGKLKALQQLILIHTKSLSALPDSIGSLENLEILDITCSGIEELPHGIGSLRKLQELRAYACENLKGIMVESMCNLSSLRVLIFTQCDKLESLPDLPSGLTKLFITCRSHKLPSLSHPTHLKCIQDLPSTQLKSSKCSTNGH